MILAFLCRLGTLAGVVDQTLRQKARRVFCDKIISEKPVVDLGVFVNIPVKLAMFAKIHSNARRRHHNKSGIKDGEPQHLALYRFVEAQQDDGKRNRSVLYPGFQ